jgi:hypothetical protein
LSAVSAFPHRKEDKRGAAVVAELAAVARGERVANVLDQPCRAHGCDELAGDPSPACAVDDAFAAGLEQDLLGRRLPEAAVLEQPLSLCGITG